MRLPRNRYALQARFHSGRSIAVHRAAKNAAQVPMLLYGLSSISIPRLVSSHDPKTAELFKDVFVENGGVDLAPAPQSGKI